LRCLSVVASLASVCVAYLLGRELGGPTLGWWTAGFLASASIHQMFAGLGRPYALGTLAALGAVHAFVLDRKRDYRTPWRFYLSALAAQSVLWLLWPTLLPLVLVTAWYAWRRLGMAGLVKATWWYALASLLLFAYLQVQTQHPQYVGEVLNNSIFRAGVWLFFTRIAHATPFGHLAARGTAGIVVSGLVFFALAAAGAVHLARLDAKAAPWRTGLLAAFAVSIGIMLLTGRQRDTMVFLLVPTVVAAVGAHTLCRNELASRAVLAGFLAVFTVVSLFFPDDPYRYVVAGDTRYAEIARRLAAEIKPGDTWVALPEFRGRVFYRCASLPEPLQVTSLPELQQAIAERSSAGSLFVFSRYDYPELRQTLVSGDQLWVFPKDYAIARFAPCLRGEPDVVPFRVVAPVADARGPDRRLREIVLPLRVEERVERARRGVGARCHSSSGSARRARIDAGGRGGERGDHHQTP